MVFHRARRLLAPAERTTLLPSFVALGGGDCTNVDSLRTWADPGMLAELARHESHRAREKLGALIDALALESSPAAIADAIEAAVGDLNRYAANLRGAGDAGDGAGADADAGDGDGAGAGAGDNIGAGNNTVAKPAAA